MMKFLALAVFLVVAVFQGVQGENKTLDEQCDPIADTCTDGTDTFVCDTLATPNVCKIKVDQNCTSNTDKCVTGASCDTTDTNTCKCGNGYTNTTSEICDLNPNVVGGSCTVSAGEAFTQGTCDDSNAVCTDKTAGTCVCRKGHTGETAGTCVVTPDTSDGSCNTTVADDQGSCKDSNHQCNATTNGVCNCKTGYQKETGSGCKLKVEISGEDCTASGVVCVDNSECDTTSKQCKCKTGYQKITGDVCGPANNTLGGSCSGTSCTDSNAECGSGSICTCKANYFAPIEKCKLKVGVSGVDCTTTGNECLEYASCGSNKQCSCNENFMASNGFCLPDDNKFGGKCSISTTMVGPKGTCSDANAVCDYGRCLCKENYKGTPGGGCASGANSLVASAFLFLMPAAYLLATIY